MSGFLDVFDRLAENDPSDLYTFHLALLLDKVEHQKDHSSLLKAETTQ